MPALALRVNGQERTADVPQGMPLLWALRDLPLGSRSAEGSGMQPSCVSPDRPGTTTSRTCSECTLTTPSS